MNELSKVIVFKLRNEQYGVDLQQIRSIERLQSVTEVPQSENFIKGIINLRGEIIPLIDLKERLHGTEAEHLDSTRILIIQIGETLVGLIVDAATDVKDIDASQIQPAPPLVGGITKEYLKGVITIEEKLLILLDLEKILGLDEIEALEEVSQN